MTSSFVVCPLHAWLKQPVSRPRDRLHLLERALLIPLVFDGNLEEPASREGGLAEERLLLQPLPSTQAVLVMELGGESPGLRS